MDNPPTERRLLVTAIVLFVVAGVMCTLVLLASRLLWLPDAFEPVARLAYRVVYFAGLPVRLFFMIFIPAENYSWPAWGDIPGGMLTPPFVYLVWRVLKRSWQWGSKPASEAESDETNALPRRAFLQRSTLSIAGVSAVAAGGYGALLEPQQLRLRRYALPIGDLPPAFDGFRIAHVSDTHYGPYVALPFLKGMVRQVNALKPDLVILTGDYIHKTERAAGPGVEVLTAFESRLGTVATLGNHDHWVDTDSVRERFSDARVPLLDNARRFLATTGWTSDAKVGGAICIAGLGDLWTDAIDYDAALSDLPERMPRLLLSHNPDTAELVDAQKYRVDAMLSGHTHGGQIYVPGIPNPLIPSSYGTKYKGGLCAGPHFPVLVSQGVGLAGMPVRFGVPPEFSLITLTKQSTPR